MTIVVNLGLSKTDKDAFNHLNSRGTIGPACGSHLVQGGEQA
jgi:hypothetical protein